MTRRFIFYLFSCFLIIAITETRKLKIKLISVDKCDAPADKMDPTEPVTYETGAISISRYTKVARTNFTVLRPVGPLTMSLRIYYKKKNSNEEIFKMEKVDCNNPITYQLVRVINVKLNDKCMAAPGNYLTEKINPQDFAWILNKAMINPGKFEFLLEFHSDKGIAVCNTIVCDILETK